jgi:hypothetical protein
MRNLFFKAGKKKSPEMMKAARMLKEDKGLRLKQLGQREMGRGDGESLRGLRP